MELTLENFTLSIAIISGRRNPMNVSVQEFQNMGWGYLHSPTENEAREVAEAYISLALQDLSAGLAGLSIAHSELNAKAIDTDNAILALTDRVSSLEGA